MSVAFRSLLSSIKIFSAYLTGFRFARQLPHNIVTFLGGARIKEGSVHYTNAFHLAEAIAREGFPILTGGGPGIMEAANKGAQKANSPSYGFNICLPFEQYPNPYVDYLQSTNYFFVRKFFLIQYSLAFVVMPGGLGTLDELSEILTLIQTGKIASRPIFIYDTAYHTHLIKFLEQMVAEQTASCLSTLPIYFTDNTEDIISKIKETANSIKSKNKK